MSVVLLSGNKVHTSGDLPKIGDQAKDFELTATDMSTKTLADFKGHQLIILTFLSVDTSTCSAELREFNKSATAFKNTKVLCVSRDLPFTQDRFCGAEGIDNVVMLSDFKSGAFAKSYGIEMIDGPLQGLPSRNVIIIDEEGKIQYTQQVPEVSHEPDYADVLDVL
ncbi:thiol peroxidase (atypical 2-Cys peroxiredoxin) [Lishizhenia tianjinensis]|uniref:Thiol peroxidase (Atypical 2-Cys peroxiredoxin) n=1 Tax=Lishizhenia tianjinensis TaxID=477690 RepID=A0A1I6XU47_9FLAO|nr:thiol peroxidase [Lishizhenia tianjinensis]SFT41617.1 thiol peroxidase (atypical 2-Cys peroxiredoxin) [Lishizhenia tianjinensis]